MMRELGVRNIDGYNRAIGAGGDAGRSSRRRDSGGQRRTMPMNRSSPVEHRKLPKIVIVIDELADLLL